MDNLLYVHLTWDFSLTSQELVHGTHLREILYQALAIHGSCQHGPVYDIILWTHGRTETHISVGAGRGLRVRILALPLSQCLGAQFSHL